MKTLKKLSIIVAVGLSTVFFSGCSDYLDVSDDLAAELSMEEVFNNCDTITVMRDGPPIYIFRNSGCIKHYYNQRLCRFDRIR